MYQKILVAIDTSERGKNVFEKALSLAKTNNANLMLLHVLSPEEDNSPLAIPTDFSAPYCDISEVAYKTWQEQWQTFENIGLEVLHSFEKKAKQAEVNVELKQFYGSASRVICKEAKDWQADLIVVGRRGRSGLSEMILGSVSNYVLHHAHCSVLIVQ
ncbi:MAG: universal stress protein [Gomphosphaeria aponina SAG 52.96 = DSM 107014]|uniref:Universal stress protein n=1 Tax=Gomphosphaeria aponina SAG 52.96 = DSM 107014 TaxID=1521640 RepID=A0A941GPC2_9CHRO|nr:universal stress protein [Gomphosphaeria aponina SAG 52.96 = DSM 107014]